MSLELLIACARAERDPEAIRAFARVETDWSAVLRTARAHAVLPLVHLALEAHARDLVPAEAREALAAEFRSNATHNLFLGAELARITTLLADAGVESIAFKGAAVAALAYGDLRQRQFGDLDLLVREEKRARAEEVLAADGFRRHAPLSAAQERAMMRWCPAVTLERPPEAVIDLHWRFSAFPLLPDVQAAWRSHTSATILGRKVPVLAPAQSFLLLCAHGTLNAWQRLGWLCDVDRTVRAGGIDWDEVMLEARRTRNLRMVQAALVLSHRVLGTPMNDVRERGAMRAARIGERLLHDSPRTRNAAIGTMVLATRERLRDKLAFLLRVALQPTGADIAAVALPRALAWAYVPLRVMRLVRIVRR